MQHVMGTTKARRNARPIARRNARRGVTPAAAWPLAVRRTHACA
ncbi:hypothetical protein ACVK00_000641 [Burkholderia sp. PvR073]